MLKKIITIASLFTLFIGMTAYAAISGGSGGGIGAPNYWKLSGTTLSPVNPLWSVTGVSGNLFGGQITDLATSSAIAQGDIIVRNGSSKWTNVPIGTAGYVLTASSTAPTKVEWKAVSASASININGVATSTFTFNGTTNELEIATSTDTLTFGIPDNSQLSIAKITNLTSNGFVKTSGGDGTLSVDTSTYITAETDPVVGAINGIVKSNGAGTISSATAGVDYQAALVSGTNIKTVNGTTLLGSGDLGTIGTGYGGTATTTTPQQDGLLIGNGTNYDIKTLTAGTNITITTSSNLITINSTASGSSASTTLSENFIKANPTASENSAFKIFNATSTLTKISTVDTGAKDSFTFNIVWGPTLTASGTQKQMAFSSNQLVNNTVGATTTAYWKFDEPSGNAGDSVNGYTLTNNGTTPYSSGLINNSADFGSSNTTKYFNNTSAQLRTFPFAVSGWFKPNTVNNDGNIFSISDSTTNYYQLKLNSADSHIVMRSNAAANAGNVDSGITANIGSWYQFLVNFNSATNIDIYINGSVATTSATMYDASSGLNNFAVGALGRSTPLQFYSGIVDELGVFGRALTSQEETTLYNSSIGIQYPFLSPVVYTSFASSTIPTGSIMRFVTSQASSTQALLDITYTQ